MSIQATDGFLRQVRVIDPVSERDQVADVLIQGGRLAAITPSLPAPPAGVEIIDGQGKMLAPGIVDLYSHCSEPGHESRETLADFLDGAIAGGITRIGILPDTDPPLDSLGAIHHLLDLTHALPQPQPLLLPWAALTYGTQGEQMTELATFAQNRHVRLAGFADGKALNNVVLLRRSLEYTHSLQRPLALWPCDRALVGNGIARDGAIALMGGLPGIPSAAETAAIAMILELVREIGTPVHLMRISTARSVELVARAKQEGLPITASTTWLHLLFSTQDILTYDPSLRLDPPLGNPEDVAALVDAVKSGTIDAIALDHHPYTYEEKTVAFGDAPPGAIGLSIAFAALWQRFVEPGEWTALELMRAMSLGPARCLNLAPSCLAVGQPMEAFLFDPHTEWVVDKGTVRTPALNTPFLHQSLTGKVLRVWPVTSISHSGMQIA